MVKSRSPEYPAISLDDAIEKVRLIWTNDYQNKVPKRVIAEHMGYKGLNGGSLPIISALTKYGLLVGRGNETHVSDLAVKILAHDPGTPDRAAALKEAAEAPDLFSELDAKFQGGKASDAAIRSYLIVKKFIPSAADAAIRAYRDTKRLVESESAGHSMTPRGQGAPDSMQASVAASRDKSPRSGLVGTPAPLRETQQGYETTFTPASGAEPFRVTFTGSGVEVTAKITSPSVADDLIRAIEALKLLLRPAGQATKPDWADKTFLAGEFAPAAGLYSAHHFGHMGSGQIELGAGEPFPDCAGCVGGHVRYTVIG